MRSPDGWDGDEGRQILEPWEDDDVPFRTQRPVEDTLAPLEVEPFVRRQSMLLAAGLLMVLAAAGWLFVSFRPSATSETPATDVAAPAASLTSTSASETTSSTASASSMATTVRTTPATTTTSTTTTTESAEVSTSVTPSSNTSAKPTTQPTSNTASSESTDKPATTESTTPPTSSKPTTLFVPPQTPTGLRVSALTESSITVEWDSAAGAAGYLVYSEKIERSRLTSDETSFTFTRNVGPGRNYLLEVATVGTDDSRSGRAGVLQTTPGVDEFNMNTALNPNPSYEVSGTTAVISWPNVRGNAGYAIFLDRQWLTEDPPGVDQTEYTITGLQPNSLHLVEVRTQSPEGNSQRVPILVKTES